MYYFTASTYSHIAGERPAKRQRRQPQRLMNEPPRPQLAHRRLQAVKTEGGDAGPTVETGSGDDAAQAAEAPAAPRRSALAAVLRAQHHQQQQGAAVPPLLPQQGPADAVVAAPAVVQRLSAPEPSPMAAHSISESAPIPQSTQPGPMSPPQPAWLGQVL